MPLQMFILQTNKMSTSREPSEVAFIVFSVASTLTCLSSACLLIFGLIAVTNANSPGVSYNNGAAQVVFAVGNILVFCAMLIGLGVSLYLVKREKKLPVVTTSGP